MKKSVLAIVSSALFSAAANSGTIEMKVYGLVCGFCAQGIEKTLRKYPATADVLVSLESQLVAIQTRDGADLSDVELTSALTEAGYDVKGIERTNRSLAEIRKQLGRNHP